MNHNPAIVCAYFHSQGVNMPVLEYRFHPTRKWRFDFSWPEYKVALEVEGGCFMTGGGRHNRGAGVRNDMEKYNSCTVMGWSVLRILPEQLLKLDTVEMVKACIARKGLQV